MDADFRRHGGELRIKSLNPGFTNINGLNRSEIARDDLPEWNDKNLTAA